MPVSRIAHVGFLALLLALCVAVASAQQDGIQKDQMLDGWQESDNMKSMPGIWINFTQREFYTTGFIRVRQGPIELLACSPGSDKVHEVILQSNCSPTDFHLAMTLCRFKHGKPVGVDDKGNVILPSGDRVIIYLEWEKADGTRVRKRFEDLIMNVLTRKPMRRNGWVFTGSSFRVNPYTNKEVFLANEVKTLIATYHDPSAILDNPSITGTNDSLFEGNAMLLPPEGTKIRMIVAHPTEEDVAQWKKWEEEHDDESDLFQNPADTGEVIEPTRFWNGLDSDYDDAYFPQPIRDNDEFAKLWTHLYAKSADKPALPAIDFDKYMLSALLGGLQPSTGYAIHAREVKLVNDEYYILFEDIVPAAGAPVEKREISPWELVMLPRIEGRVIFVPFKGDEPAEHTMVESWQGQNPDMNEGTRIIRNKNDWSELWTQAFSSHTAPPPVPDIDFNHHLVLGVFAGAIDHEGASINIHKLEKNENGLIVHYTVTEATGDATDEDYGPFHVIVTQKTEKPITFERHDK